MKTVVQFVATLHKDSRDDEDETTLTLRIPSNYRKEIIKLPARAALEVEVGFEE